MWETVKADNWPLMIILWSRDQTTGIQHIFWWYKGGKEHHSTSKRDHPQEGDVIREGVTAGTRKNGAETFSFSDLPQPSDDDNKLGGSDAKLFWFITRQAKKEIKLEFTTLHQGQFFWDRASLNENSHARIFHRRLDDARSSSSSECEDRSCFLFCLRRSPLYLFPFSSSWDTCFVLPFELSMETESLGFSITQIRKVNWLYYRKKEKKTTFETETNGGSP